MKIILKNNVCLHWDQVIFNRIPGHSVNKIIYLSPILFLVYINDNTPELNKLHWLPVEEKISFKILLITFKCLNNLAPKYLSDLISIHKPTRHLWSPDSVLLDMPRIEQVTYGGRAFSYAAPFLWNKLAREIRTWQHLQKFILLLKTHVFRTASDSCYPFQQGCF